MAATSGSDRLTDLSGTAAPTVNAPTTKQKPPKSPPAAFEPTPNDALFSSLDMSLPPPMLPHPAMHQPSPLPIRDTIPSASPIPLSNGTSRHGASMVTSPLTPPDNSTVGAESRHGSSADEWRQLLAHARSSFENERQVWEQERQLYQRDIARLQQALEAKQQELIVMATKLKQAELAVADPASFHAGIVSPTSDPRGPSPMISPPSGLPAAFISPPGGIHSHHSNLQTPPIPGVPGPMAMFAITHHGSGEISSAGVPHHGPLSGTIDQDEDPASPVTTAANLSPPPEAYRRHAGHTPGKFGSFSIETTPGEKTPRATQPIPDDLASQQTDGSVSGDEDPAMKSPLFLPSNPAKSGDAATLSTLQDKLASICEHPEEQTPAVLQGVPPSVSSSSDVGEEGDAVPPLELDEADAGSEVPGIRLKSKRSCNFGAPMGIMPRYRNASDFDDF